MQNYYVYVYCGENKHSLQMKNDGTIYMSNLAPRPISLRNVLQVINFGLVNIFPDKVEVIPAG